VLLSLAFPDPSHHQHHHTPPAEILWILPTSNTLLIRSPHTAIALTNATMLLLLIFLAAKALAASTCTVTVLDDNPDARTLSTPASTAAGDVVTYLTLYPDGVNPDGQTRYVRQTGVSAEQTVTSLLEIPPTTTPTASPAGTVTQGLPWHNGHHIEVLTVTDPDGTVHEVTRIDQQSTHVTVHLSTMSNGDEVLVSSGFYPPETTTDNPTYTATDSLTGTTTVTDVAPLPTEEKLLGPARTLPVCNNGSITWPTIEPACWPVYDMLVPTPPPANLTKPAQCTGGKHRTVSFTIASIPMKGSVPSDPADTSKEDEKAWRELKDEIKDSFKSHNDGCEAVQHFVNFGTCGDVQIVQPTGPEILRIKHKPERKSWLRRWWWIIPLVLLGLGLFLLPCLLCMRRRKRRNAEKLVKQEPVTVIQQPVPVVVATGAGGSGGAAGSTSSGVVPVGAAGSGGAGGAGSTTTGTTAPTTTTAPTGAAPATTTTTAAPTEVVTTTTEPDRGHAGTMRRAAEEGRAGQRVRFDGQPADHNPTAAHQVDGTAELRTGSEVFDVGSMRGRKRNRGDEPL
jgi:hypothetical protein